MTFCIELYAEHIGIESPDVYQKFLSTGLMEFIRKDYDDLHGMSFEYLNQFFDEYLEAKK
jgi:hypothetical protein